MAATAEAPARAEKTNGGLIDQIVDQPASMSRELATLKMENEVMMAECRMRPRDFAAIKAELLAQLRAFPDLASEAIYEKPVGKDPDTGQQKYARGLSIRAAETLAESYRYNRIRSDVTELEGGDKVKIEATFTDFQGCRIWQDAGILSKTYKDRSGRIQRMNDDRFYNVIVKAEASKRIREVILRSVNTGLKAWFESECEKISAGLLDDETVAKIVTRYHEKNVTVEMLEGLIGRPRSMGWTEADKQRLLSIWNALKDGETTVAEVFSDRPDTPLPTPTKDKPAAPGPIGGKAPTADDANATALFLDEARAAAGAITSEDVERKYLDEYLGKATTEEEKAAVQKFAAEQRGKWQGKPAKGQKQFAGT